MVPYAWMGVLALAVFWTNTLLVAAAAFKSSVWIGRNRMPRRMAVPADGVGVAAVRVESGRGPNKELAVHEVEQRGRRTSNSHAAIAWHDRHFRSIPYGGTATWSHERLRVEPTRETEVWPDPAAQAEAAAPPDRATIEDALSRAAKAKGELRHVRVPVAAGDAAWIAGAFRRHGGEWLVEPCPDLPVIISQVDPHRWATHARLRLRLFALGVVAVAGGITFLTVRPPVFGTVSTLGGALALAFFLLVQPAGTWIRDRTQLPPYRSVAGRWTL